MSGVGQELAVELRDLGADDHEAAAVLDALAGLEDLVDGAPAPSAELAALLGRGPRAAGPSGTGAARRTARRSGTVGGVVVALVVGAGATGLSAAANTLPAPLQERVSSFSRSHLPFTFPHPSARPERRPWWSGAPTVGLGPESGAQQPHLRGGVPLADPPAPAVVPLPSGSPDSPEPAASSEGRPPQRDADAGERPRRTGQESRPASPTASPSPAGTPSSSPSPAAPPSPSPSGSRPAHGWLPGPREDRPRRPHASAAVPTAVPSALPSAGTSARPSPTVEPSRDGDRGHDRDRDRDRQHDQDEADEAP